MLSFWLPPCFCRLVSTAPLLLFLLDIHFIQKDCYSVSDALTCIVRPASQPSNQNITILLAQVWMLKCVLGCKLMLASRLVGLNCEG